MTPVQPQFPPLGKVTMVSYTLSHPVAMSSLAVSSDIYWTCGMALRVVNVVDSLINKLCVTDRKILEPNLNPLVVDALQNA